MADNIDILNELKAQVEASREAAAAKEAEEKARHKYIKSQLPSPQDFYLNFPLYKLVEYPERFDEEGWTVKYFDDHLDSYCPQCGSHSVFNREIGTINHAKDGWIGNRKFEVIFKCSRNSRHVLYFLFQVFGRTIQKIGQLPSLADLCMYDVQKYSGVLEKKYFRELTKAIGLAAHGVGVGSFVYLRRIFESLIDDAHKVASLASDWDEAAFLKGRVADRIEMLSHELPDFLVENRAMYGILSKGVHELSEEECLNAFPIVKLGIEIILDAKLEETARKEKLAKAKKSIDALASLTRK